MGKAVSDRYVHNLNDNLIILKIHVQCIYAFTRDVVLCCASMVYEHTTMHIMYIHTCTMLKLNRQLISG